MAEAAKRLGIPRSSAYDLAARGLFPVPVISLGRRKVVSRAALERLIDPDAASPENFIGTPTKVLHAEVQITGPTSERSLRPSNSSSWSNYEASEPE